MPRWILFHFKLKFCWMKLFALIVTRIVHSINLEITTEDTLEAIVNL
jgi:hypothetical protein